MTTFSWLYRLNQVMTTVIFQQPPPGSWQGGIRTHEPIGTDLQSACFDHLHTCQELPSRWQLPGVLPPITVSLQKKTGLNFTSADKLNIKKEYLLQYAKLQWGWQVSNLRHAGYKPAALPLSYIPQPSPGRLAALFIVLCATLCGYLSFLSCYRQPTRCSFFLKQ